MPAVASQALLSHRRKQSPFVHPEALLRAPPSSWPRAPSFCGSWSDQVGVDLSQFHTERRSVSASIDDSSRPRKLTLRLGFECSVRHERGMQAVCGTVHAA